MIYVKLLTGEKIMESVSEDTTVAEIMSRTEHKHGKIVKKLCILQESLCPLQHDPYLLESDLLRNSMRS